jgi:hypothetical protein
MPPVIGFLEWKQHQHKINSACDLGQTPFPPSPYLRAYIVNRWDPSLMELFLELKIKFRGIDPDEEIGRIGQEMFYEPLT